MHEGTQFNGDDEELEVFFDGTDGLEKDFTALSVEHRFRLLDTIERIQGLANYAVRLTRFGNGQLKYFSEMYLEGLEDDSDSITSEDRSYLQMRLSTHVVGAVDTSGRAINIFIPFTDSKEPEVAFWSEMSSDADEDQLSLGDIEDSFRLLEPVYEPKREFPAIEDERFVIIQRQFLQNPGPDELQDMGFSEGMALKDLGHGVWNYFQLLSSTRGVQSLEGMNFSEAEQDLARVPVLPRSLDELAELSTKATTEENRRDIGIDILKRQAERINEIDENIAVAVIDAELDRLGFELDGLREGSRRYESILAQMEGLDIDQAARQLIIGSTPRHEYRLVAVKK